MTCYYSECPESDIDRHTHSPRGYLTRPITSTVVEMMAECFPHSDGGQSIEEDTGGGTRKH